MGSIYIAVPPEVAAALDALEAAVAKIGEMNLDNYGAGVRLHALERLETARRRPSYGPTSWRRWRTGAQC
jgi:hypothetical protein